MEPIVVLIYGHKARYQTYLERQLTDAGIRRLNVEMAGPFSWRRQLEETHRIACEFPRDMLLVIDAWDQILLGTKKELVEHAENTLQGSVTLAGARNCWPTDRKFDYYRKRGPAPSPWCFINNSPLAGCGSDIARAIEYGNAHFPILQDDASILPSEHVPERFWTQLYLEGPDSLKLRIDTECELNQTFLSMREEEYMIRRGRLFNKITGTQPIFLHLNGGRVLPYGLA